MALADRSTAPKQRGPSCSIGKMLATFTPDDAATLRAWLADPDIQGSVIARELSAELGRRVTSDVVRHHRTGACCCGTR